MDEQRFDRFTQALAGSKSRRNVIAAAAAGLFAIAIGRDRAAAVDSCGSGFILCDDECHYSSTSHDHCGSCNNNCGDLVCTDGACSTCESHGETTCYDSIGEANYCADLNTSFIDCGACGNICTTGPCEDGECVSTADCDEGFTECLGQCVDLQTSVHHCGACGNACMGIPPEGQSSIGVCVEGGCEIVCNEGYTVCAGDPVDFCAALNGDPNNCGTCGNVCADSVCTDGECGGEVVATTDNPTPSGEFEGLRDFGDFVRLVERTSLELMRQGLAAFPSEAFVGLPSDTRTRLGKIRDHDKAHLASFDRMPELSGGQPPAEPELTFTFADVSDFIARANALKQTTTAAYVLMLQATTVTYELRSALAEIAIVEGRHAAWLTMHSGEPAFTDATERRLTRTEILEELAALSA